MSESTQDAASSETYLDNWATHLSQLPTAGITISSATVTASDGATVTNVATANAGTGITFKLNMATITVTPPKDIRVNVSATLSNGDTPVRHHTIGVTN